MQRAEAASKQKDHGKALELMQESLAYACAQPHPDPKRKARIHLNLGIILDDLARPMNSILAMTAAMAVDPDYLRALDY